MQVNINEFRTTHNNSTEAKYYTLIGQQTFVDDSGYPRVTIENEIVYAKAIRNKPGKVFNSELQYRFYIKTDPNKKIYDPIELHSITEKNKGSFLNRICKTETVFSEVTEHIFNQYITFLKTKNTKLLQSAQRELK